MTEDPLAALEAAYGAALPAKIEAIAQAVAGRDRATARLLAHRLCGTSGSYGFALVGLAAGRLEDALDAGAEWSEIEPLLERLRRNVADPRANG